MKKIICLSYIFGVILLYGCATAHKMNYVSYGMTKQDVIRNVGRPTSTSANGPVEYLNYKLTDNSNAALHNYYTNYFVKLVDDRVVTFGKLGDFDSTKDPTININTNSKVETQTSTKDSNTDKMYDELVKLKSLLDSGIITEDEFEKKKKEILEKY